MNSNRPPTPKLNQIVDRKQAYCYYWPNQKVLSGK